jgi:hypothetical protein
MRIACRRLSAAMRKSFWLPSRMFGSLKIKSSCRATQWRLSERWFNEALTMAGRTRPDIVRRYEDALGNWRDAPKQTVAAVDAAMGQPPPGKRRIGHGGTSRPTEKIARSGGTDLGGRRYLALREHPRGRSAQRAIIGCVISPTIVTATDREPGSLLSAGSIDPTPHSSGYRTGRKTSRAFLARYVSVSNSLSLSLFSRGRRMTTLRSRD